MFLTMMKCELATPRNVLNGVSELENALCSERIEMRRTIAASLLTMVSHDDCDA